MSTCRGVDVSVYQGAQDWTAREAEGVVFAFAKASEGQHTRDDHFATHITGIKKAGLVPGAYHFGWPTQDVALEAANYIAAVRPYAGRGFVHWLDLERRSDGKNYAGRSAAQIRAWAAKWLDLVGEAFPGQRVGVYTSGDDLAKDHIPAGTTVWYPAYTWGYVATPYSKAEAAARPKPSGWSPLFWQFTSTPIDRSICYLSEAALREWAAGDETDMALTTDDISKVAAATAAKLIAGGGVLETDDVTRVAAAVAAKLQPVEAAQSATIDKLVTAVATLAANIGGLDPAAIVAELKAAIESIDVHLDVTSPTA